MTRQKKFKKRVRARAAKTGESYASARRNEEEHADLIEEMKHIEPPLTEMQKAQLQREESNRQWMKDNPGLKVVTLTLTHNEYGTPTIHVSGPELTSVQITQPPDVYVDAIRQAYQDSEWAKAPRDDLGDLPGCDPLPEGTFYDSFPDLVKAMSKVRGRVMSLDDMKHGLVGFAEILEDNELNPYPWHWVRASSLGPVVNQSSEEPYSLEFLEGLMNTARGRTKVAEWLSENVTKPVSE